MPHRVIDNLPSEYEAARVFKSSRFISQYCLNHADELESLLAGLHQSYDKTDFQKALASLPLTDDEAYFKKKIRKFRIRQTIRIAWRSIISFARVEETLLELSYLADSLVLHALSYAHQQLLSKHQLQALTQLPKLYVVALGKLGGYELNFSSDIDIYFVYPEEIALKSDNSFLASQFYTQVAQKLLHLLADKTADSFVYRVDLRLRPYGQSGPMVMNHSQLEAYYQEQGRDWERYSLIKARVINASDDKTKALENILRPFTYRRYTDFSVLESLRSLKLLMAREDKLKKMADDIKRGPGGIREVEFLIQSLQLIYGGRDSRLQNSSLFIALRKLHKKGLLAIKVAESLKEAYCFFRLIENAIQFYEDKQRHKLPLQEEAQQALCYALNIENYKTLYSQLDKHRQFVKEQFSAILSHNEKSDDDDKLFYKQLQALWLGQLSDIPTMDVLSSLGFDYPERAYSQLQEFAASPKCRRLSQVARLRLDNFMPLLLLELSKVEVLDSLLTLMLRLLDGIIKRSAYLALLIENPGALHYVIKLFSRSELIANLVSEQPFLLEVLLDESELIKSLDKDSLQQSLHELIQGNLSIEKKLECLKEFKHKHLLKIASREVFGEIDAFRASGELTLVTEIILHEILSIAFEELSLKLNKKFLSDHFLVIAYGKLGSHEMGYTSDLDLVFLHDCTDDMSSYAIKLAQKVLHLIQTRTVHGKLYQVDTRLRPSGSAGMLVSHIDAFADYQRTKAWTWEHQALVKARVITGGSTLALQFNQLRSDILCIRRDKKQLYSDISSMLEKMRKETECVSKKDEIKLSRGGLVEIEFFVQFSVLGFSCQYPELLEARGTVKLITLLSSLKLLSADDADLLSQSYQFLMQSLHWYALKGADDSERYHSELVHELLKKIYRILLG